LSGGATSKLSHQDLVGYATLRSLRKSPRYLEEPAYDEEIHNDSAWEVPVSIVDDFNALVSSTSSIKRFSVHESASEGEDRCYMGIGLPQAIHSLFLDADEETRDASLEKFPIINDEIVYAMHDFKVREETLWKHETELCLLCSGKASQDDDIFMVVAGGRYLSQLSHENLNRFFRSFGHQIRRRQPRE
jgi:hypothetical protein